MSIHEIKIIMAASFSFQNLFQKKNNSDIAPNNWHDWCLVQTRMSILWSERMKKVGLFHYSQIVYMRIWNIT